MVPAPWKLLPEYYLAPMARLTLEDFKITTSFPVHWGDMDAAQHVNNLVYMKWTETARLLYFEEMGTVSYTPFRAHETGRHLVCRLLLEKKKKREIEEENRVRYKRNRREQNAKRGVSKKEYR